MRRLPHFAQNGQPDGNTPAMDAQAVSARRRSRNTSGVAHPRRVACGPTSGTRHRPWPHRGPRPVRGSRARAGSPDRQGDRRGVPDEDRRRQGAVDRREERADRITGADLPRRVEGLHATEQHGVQVTVTAPPTPVGDGQRVEVDQGSAEPAPLTGPGRARRRPWRAPRRSARPYRRTTSRPPSSTHRRQRPRARTETDSRGRVASISVAHSTSRSLTASSFVLGLPTASSLPL